MSPCTRPHGRFRSGAMPPFRPNLRLKPFAGSVLVGAVVKKFLDRHDFDVRSVPVLLPYPVSLEADCRCSRNARQVYKSDNSRRNFHLITRPFSRLTH